MTTITLPEYHDRIEKMIDENMLTDAVNHCRHVLENHPSDINTYRLLAKALLEQHDYDGAGDLFQRVLSADPNDFVAHVGLSIIRAEESQVETALWHLQRAFEIEPYNPAIQEELRRHYAQFSDMAVDRIPLTSGALARLYIKGELYQQAVQELRQTIQEDQDRVDLEVLLAEALWRNDQRVDAEEVCLNVLQKLPNCIAVNAILSEIWLQTGRIGESQKYLRRLIGLTSLDKNSINLDTAVGRAFRADGAPALPDEVEIEVKGEMDMALPAAASSAKGPSAEWMSEVTFDSDSGKTYDYERLDVVSESPSGMHNYDWMAEVNDDLVAEENLPMESEWFMDDSLKSEPSLEDDWLADVEAAAGPTAVADDFDLLFADDEDVSPLEPAAGEPENEDWFLAQSESELQADETFASEQSVPEWLAPLVNEPDMADIGQEFEEDAAGSDWFADSVKDESVPDTEGDMPDWLSTLVDDKVSSPGEADFVEVDLDQATAVADEPGEWEIDEHAEDHWDEPDYTEEEMPDWLLKQTGELEGEVAADASGDEMDDWLAEAAGAAADPDDQEAESGLAGWLSDEPEEVPGMVKGAAALGLTAMFAALDDDVPEAESASAAAEMDEMDDLFAGVSDMAGATAVAPSATDDEDDDAWFAALESAGDEEPFVTESGAGSEETAVTLDDLRASMADESAADISLDSDWLTLGDEVWDEDLVADDLADLTPESTDLAAEFSQTFMIQSDLDDELAESETTDEEIPDWLLGDAQVRLGEVEATAMGDNDEDEAALPEPEDDFADLDGDWLSDFTSDEDEEALPDDTELDVTPALESVPDWLAGFEDDEAPEAEMEDEWASESFADAPQAMADDELDEEEVPDWLQGVAEESTADAMVEMGDEEADELFDVLADMSGGKSAMADWLADDEPGLADEAWAFDDEFEEEAVEETAVPSGGMTAWLNALPESEPETTVTAEDVPEIPSEELFATDSENLPDWLSSSVDDTVVAEAEDSNLPDWLLDGGTDVPDQLDSDDLFGTDDDGALEVMGELDELEEGLADEEDWDEGEIVDDLTAVGLTAVGLTALLSSIDDEPATVADLSTDTEIEWLGELDETETGLPMDMADEMELDWLEEAEEVEEADTAVAAMAEPDMLDVGDDAPAEELDDAISWLEELASQQETPVEDMPTVAENLLAEELAAAEGASTQMVDNDLDAAFDDVLDEAFAEAFPDIGAEEAEIEATAEEAEGDSWLDVLMAEEEADEAAMSAPPTDDPEAAMAWLEGLAAKQGAPLEELPSLQGRDQGDLDHLVDEAQADLDDALAWMDNLAEPETKEEWPELDEELLAAAMSGAVIARTSSQPAVDNELVEALNILEEQVKAEGIASPVAGGTAVVSDTELMAALDWLEESLDEGEITAVAEETDLLEDLVAAEMQDTGELPEAEGWEEENWDWDQPESITDLLTVAAKPIVAKPADDEEDLSVMDMPDDPDEAMEWLARIAADETSEPEESLAMVMDEEWDDQVEADDLEPASAAPDTAVATIEEDFLADTLPEPDDLDFSDMPDDPDEAMNWLLNMAEGDAAIDFDMQPPPITPSEDAAFAVDYGPSSEPEMEVVEEMDTAVASEALAAAEVVAAEMALEDEEDLLAGMLDDDFEIDFDMQPPPITPSEDAAFAVDYGTSEVVSSELESEVVEEMDTVIETSAAAEEAEAISADETVVISAEDDEDWLAGMLDDDFEIDFDMQPPPITPSEDAAFAVDYGPSETPDVETELEATPLAISDEEDILAAVPEDPDEAMAWLQKIANEQSGDLETAVPVDDAPLPAWLEIGAAEEGESELSEITEILSEPSSEGELGLLDDLGMDIEDDLADSLPSWLSVDSGRSSGTGQTGWLTSVENIDVFNWLAAEEEATVTGFDEDAMPPDTGEIRPSSIPASDHLPSLTLPESDMPAESFEVQPVTDELDSRQLSTVHEVLAEKKYEEAAQHYQQLIASGTATLGLIAELESLADEYPDQPAFRRLLGDAYMRNGQLQKALNAYRGALDQL